MEVVDTQTWQTDLPKRRDMRLGLAIITRDLRALSWRSKVVSTARQDIWQEEQTVKLKTEVEIRIARADVLPQKIGLNSPTVSRYICITLHIRLRTAMRGYHKEISMSIVEVFPRYTTVVRGGSHAPRAFLHPQRVSPLASLLVTVGL